MKRKTSQPTARFCYSHASMFAEERYRFQPHYLTIHEVWELYQQKDRPLNADTLLATLEPLAGTSFLLHATEILDSLTTRQPIHALDLALMFYGAFADTLKRTDDQQQEDAIICLYHLAGFHVPLDAVHTMKPLLLRDSISNLVLSILFIHSFCYIDL